MSAYASVQEISLSGQLGHNGDLAASLWSIFLGKFGVDQEISNVDLRAAWSMTLQSLVGKKSVCIEQRLARTPTLPSACYQILPSHRRHWHFPCRCQPCIASFRTLQNRRLG
jgi:hypothetical protein